MNQWAFRHSDLSLLLNASMKLNRQSERYAREGVDLSLSTLADQVGACAAALKGLCGHFYINTR